MAVIIDPQSSGIAGNMVVGAFVDMGMDVDPLEKVMENCASYFGDINIEIGKVKKSGIASTYADIQCSDRGHVRYLEFLERFDGIEDPEMTPQIRRFVKKVFRTIAVAESRVHGTTPEKVHFHEVGAADAVADIVGSAYAFFKLGFNHQKVYGMPVALGGGVVKSEHGLLSVPAPATCEILKNVPSFGGPVSQELTTPTGAALFVNMVDEFCSFYPLLVSRKVGYGAGMCDLEVPNVLRILKGNSPVETDNVSILETNLDNVTGELLGHTFGRLMEAGARDVTMLPTLMKKNRPGHLLRVITKPEDSEAVSRALIRETGTLGVRVLPYVHRNIVSRKIVPVEVHLNGTKMKVRIKVGTLGDEVISSRPEYEDAKKLSEKTGIPLKDVMIKIDETCKEYLQR